MAANNKIQYVLGISADTSQAKKSIAELQKALNDITVANNKKLGLDIDLNNAAKAAQQLQSSLSAAINVDTGRLNFTAFNKSLMQSNTNLNQLITQLRSTGGLGNAAVSQLARSLSTAEIPVKRLTGLLGNFATTLSNSFKWQISSNIIHGLESSMSSAVNYAKDLNETLNNIRIVTGQSVDDMAKFAASANKAAQELSTTTKEYANAALIYYQQGDSAEMAAKKAATTVKAANVAFTASAKEMSEMLTAVWNSYQVGADQLESVVDVMAKLGATTASSMEEMATAMQKVASTANTVGVSMQQMSAIVATSASVTRQAPETVGTAWNTILSRIGGLKLGETLEDGVDLNKYSSALRTVGVNILDATGQLRDMGIVIDELGGKWQTLSKGQKAALAQTIGGARQYTQIMAFFDNFDKYQKNMITAQNSAGALQEQQEIYAQGWEAASARSRAALEDLWGALIDDEAVISFTNAMTEMTKGVTGLVKAFGGLPGILATVSTLMTRTFSNQIVNGVSKAAASVVGFGQAFTKQGNGQPMSGGYTVRQFLMGRMPNAEERQQISNIAVANRELEKTANGVGLDQNNPYFEALKLSSGTQARAYNMQLEAMRQGKNLTPIQAAALSNVQAFSGHTQAAYDIMSTFNDNTQMSAQDLLTGNSEAQQAFNLIREATLHEALEQTVSAANNAVGEEKTALIHQFDELARRAGLTGETIDTYDRSKYQQMTAADLQKGWNKSGIAGLTENETRQLTHAARESTSQEVRGVAALFNPQSSTNPADQFKAIGEAARIATVGITSGVAAFNQLNSAMAAFNAGNVVQGLTGIATTATSVAQAFLTGGPWAGGIAIAGAGLGLIISQYTAGIEKAAEKAKETTDKITNDTSELQSKIQNTQTQQSLYNDLTKQLADGTISQNEFNDSLLTVANALGIQGANVLALSGNYQQLEEQIKKTIAAQLAQAEISGRDLSAQARDATASTLYTALGTYGLQAGFFDKAGDDRYKINKAINYEAVLGASYTGHNSYDPAWIENILGATINSNGAIELGTDFDSLTTFLTGIKKLEEEIQNNFGTEYASYLQTVVDSLSKTRSAVEAAVNPVQSALQSELTSKGQSEANKLTENDLKGYNSQKRQEWIDNILNEKGITEESNSEAYQLGQQVLGSIIDSTLAGIGAEGARLSVSASSATNKRTDYAKQLKEMGRSTSILTGLSDEQLNNPYFSLGYWLNGGRKNIDTTALDAWSTSQSAISAYNNRGAGFNVSNFASQFIFSNDTLAAISGTTFEDFKKMSTDAQRTIVSDWIENIVQQSDSLKTDAENSGLSKAMTEAYMHFVDDFEEVVGEDLSKFDFEALSNYTQEAFLADQENADNGKTTSELYQKTMQLGGWKNAQYWAQRYLGANVKVDDIVKESNSENTIDQLIASTQRLSEMDINDVSKWKDAYEDILQLFKDTKGKSLDDWLNMSELEKKQVQLDLINQNIAQIKAQMQEEGIGESDELVQLEYEAKQLQLNLDQLSLNQLNTELADSNQKWKEMQDAAEKALSTISSHLGDYNNMSFVEIEQLRQNLIAAGVEIQKVDSLMNKLMNKGNDGQQDKADVWASVTAAGVAALQSITAQQASAKGLYDLDIVVSKDEVQEHAESWPEEYDVNIQTGADEVKETIVSWDLNNQTLTLKLDNGETITKEIEEVIDAGDKSFTVSLEDGTTATITNDLGIAIEDAAKNNPVTITLSDGSEITGTIETWITEANDTEVTVKLNDDSLAIIKNGLVTAVKTADGTTFTATVEDGSPAGSSISQTLINFVHKANDTEFTAKVNGADVTSDLITLVNAASDATFTAKVEDGTENGQTITGTLKQLVIDASGQTFTAVVADGSEEGKTITGTLEDLVKAANGAPFTAKLADGTTAKITADLTTAVTDAESDKFVTITYNESNGEVIIAATTPETKIIKIAYEIDGNAYKQWISTQDLAFGAQGGDLSTLDLLSASDYGKKLLNGKYKLSDTAAYALRFNSQIVQNTGNIDLNNDAIKESIAQLWQISQSENGQLSSIGQFLIAGLKQGIADAGNAEDWSALISSLNLGEDVIQAFKEALGIASPSRLTMELGHYLIEGLQVGIDNSIASWDPKVNGLAGKLNEAFKESLGDFSANDFIRDAMDLDPMLGYARAEKQLQSHLADSSLNFYRSFLSGGYVRSNLSDEAKLALENLLKDSGYTAEKISTMSTEEIDKLVESLDSKWKAALIQVKNNTALTIATMHDTWKNGLSKIFDNEQDIADKTYEKWESTFKAIADARASLLNGDNILDNMLNDKKGIASILQYLMTNGMSFDAAKSYLKDPNADLSQLSFEAYSANARNAIHSGANQFFNNSDTFDWDAYQSNRRGWILNNLNSAESIQSLNDVLNASPNKNSILNQLYEDANGEKISLRDLLSFDEVSGDIVGVKNGSASIAEVLLSTLFANDNMSGQSVLSHMAQNIGYSDKTSAEEGFYAMKAADVQAEGQEMYQPWKEQADAIGTNVKELKEYADTLAKVNGQQIDWVKLTKNESQELAVNTAKIKSVESAWKDLTGSQKNNINIVSKLGNKNKAITGEQMTALQSLTKSVKQFFGNSDKVTEKFVRDNIKDIEKMVKGDEAALERLQDKLIETTLGDNYNKEIEITVNGQTASTTLGNLIDEFEDRFKNFNDGAIITPEIDTSGATSALIDLLNQGGDTADGIQAALNQVGWAPQVAYTEVPFSELTVIDGVAQVPVVDYTADGLIGGYHMEPAPVGGNVDQDTMVKIPVINNGKVQYSGLQKTGTGQSSGRTPSKGGGGGGGGKEHTKKDHKRIKDEGERYHEIRDKMEQQEHILDRIDKIKDRAYGGRHLKALNAEIEALEKQNKLQEEYYAEAAAYLASDRAELTQYGATFNPDGTVNYDEYIRKQVNWYNAQVDASNDEETDKRIEEEYKDRMKALENYEEALDLVDTIQNDILENQNKISEILLEGVQYKLEIAADLNDRDLQKLDYYINKWSEVLSKQDESMEVSMMKMGDYESSLAAVGKAYQELQKGYAEGRLNDQDYSDGLADLQDKTLEYLESIQDLKKEIEEYYENTLSLAEEKQQKYTDKIEHTRDMMQSYIEMQQLMGRGQNFAELNSMYDTSYRSSLLTARAARDYLDTLYASRAAIVKEIEDSGWTETLKAQYDSVEEHIVNAEDDLAQKTQQTLDDAKQKFMNVIDAIIKASDLAFKSLVDANGNLIKSFDEVAQDFNYWNEQQGWYVSTAKELYEVSKINRQIEDSLIDSTTATSKERLKALQSEINAYAEKNRLTEYDIEMNELQYKMALAMQDLEDTQNAKSTVRLTRDENGNYGYQYTANEDDVGEARQNFEDVLQQINELAYEHQNDLVQQMIESKQNYQSELREILDNDTLSLEERNRQAETLTEQHLAQMEYIQEQGLRAQEQLLENQGYIQEYYGQTIIENTGLVQDQIHGMMQQLMQDSSGYVEYIRTTLRQQLDEAIGGYSHDIDEVGGETGLTWGTMENSVSVYNKTNEKAAEDIKTLDQILGDSLKNIASATDSWVKHNAALETTVGNYEQLLNKMQGLQRSLADIDSINDRYYNNGAIYRPSEMGTTAALNALYNNKNTTNFTEDRFEGSANALGRLHNTTMSEYDISTSNLWNLIDSGAMSNLLGLISRGVNPNVINGNTNGDALSQVVNINASFDNIQSAQDIIDAFNQLTNLASQYAYSSGS